MRAARLRRSSPTSLPSSSPSLSRPSPPPVVEAQAMASASRLGSLSTATCGGSTPPTLQDILSDVAPPPWTLSALTAYLSQNHCLETLEFTMDAERYRSAYSELLQGPASWMQDSRDHVCSLWQKLMHAYITPYGPREVNLPAPVRDHLLSLPSSPEPPHPSELQAAVDIVYELMNDSVLLPFLESVAPVTYSPTAHEVDPEQRQGRSRVRSPKQLAAVKNEPSRSPKTSFLPQLMIGRRADAYSRGSPSSVEATDREGLTDDSGDHSPPALDPMTPPTTPPSSDSLFGSSPEPLQRTPTATNQSSGWKKMGAKLGLGIKSRSRRATRGSATSSGDSDVEADGSSRPGSGWL